MNEITERLCNMIFFRYCKSLTWEIQKNSQSLASQDKQFDRELIDKGGLRHIWKTKMMIWSLFYTPENMFSRGIERDKGNEMGSAIVPILSLKMWFFTRFGTMCTILKTWKTTKEESYF